MNNMTIRYRYKITVLTVHMDSLSTALEQLNSEYTFQCKEVNLPARYSAIELTIIATPVDFGNFTITLLNKISDIQVIDFTKSLIPAHIYGLGDIN